MTDKKIDLRKADKNELLALSRLLMSLQTAFSPVGYKITIKKGVSKSKTNQTEQKFTSIS